MAISEGAIEIAVEMHSLEREVDTTGRIFEGKDFYNDCRSTTNRLIAKDKTVLKDFKEYCLKNVFDSNHDNIKNISIIRENAHRLMDTISQYLET